MLKFFLSLSFVLISSNYLFADYLCNGELREDVPVVKIYFREVPEKPIDFKKGVPEDQITKKTEFNPDLFGGFYDSLRFESESVNGKGSVIYFRTVLHNRVLKIIDKCEIPQGEKFCFYPIANVTADLQPINNFSFSVQSLDKIYDYAELIGGLTAVNTEFGLILLVSASKYGSFSQAGSNGVYKKDVNVEGYTRVTFPKGLSYFQTFVYGKSKELYDRYVSLKIECKK